MKKTNTFKRFAAITSASILAACMVAPMAMSSNAEGETPTYSISINNTTGGHTYEAYQIFAGTLETVDGKEVLSNIVWGTGVSEEGKTALGDAAVKAKGLTTEDAVKAFADEVALYLVASACKSDDYTDSAYSISVDSPGYYLVKDQDDSLDEDADDAYTRYIVQVLGTKNNINPKASTPSVIKKVEENVKTVTATGQEFAGNPSYNVGTQYNDVADYSIGDAVSFKLYGTLPSTLGDYDSYYYCFTDTLAASLTAPDAGDVKVYIDGNEVSQGTNLRVNVTGQVITISFEDIREAGATSTSIVTVEYDAVLNENAVIGLPGQENKVDLTYSNNPNENYNPTTNNEETDTPDDTGKTPEDKVIVFTYAIDVDKIDQNDETALTGAEFLLYNSDKSKSATIENGKFVAWVDGAGGTTLTGGNITVKGLDDGTYYMKETKAPQGYNLPTGNDAFFEVEVTATTVNNQAWSGTPGDALTALAGDEESDWDVDVAIGNTKGSSLPETGGIGTTLFYLGGGAMVAVAGVYLISKKRMKNAE